MSILVVRLKNLTKDFAIGFWRPRPVRALDGVTLDVEPGEVLDYLGPNGAGKTTTLKLLMHLSFPNAGDAEILGRPDQDVALLQKGVREMPARWQDLQDIGFVYYWRLQDYQEATRWFQRANAVDGAPLDPAGYTYVLDPRSGRVSVSPQSPLFPLPGAPRPTGAP